MKRPVYLFQRFLLVALLVVSARSVQAQTDIDHDHVTPVGCGTLSITDELVREAVINTPIVAPEVARQAELEARTGKKRAKITADFDVVIGFYVINSSVEPARFDLIDAGLAYDGRLVRIWVDLKDTTRVTAAKVAQLARALDTSTAAGSRDVNKGVVENNQDVYGPPPTTYLVEGKTDFLLTDIHGKLDAQGQVTLGFFSPRDQIAQSQFEYSNEMNLLYVDDKEGLAGLTRLLGIVSHEHQHLLHYAQNVASRSSTDGDGYTFYNEGASELATILNGYAFRSNAPYLANTNVDLLRYDRLDGNKQEVDYERSMVFLLYLYEQFGESFIRNFVKVQSTGVTRINSAMELSGINLSDRNWTSVIKGFAVANYAQTAPASLPMYGFRFHPQGSKAATPKKTFTGETFDASGTIDLERYASAYYVYNNAGPMTITPSSAVPSRATAMMVMYFKNNELVAVEEKAINGSAIEVGRAVGTYDKIVLGFASLNDEHSTTLNWTVSKLTLGFREENATSGGLSIAAISPNPARDEAYVSYQSVGGALRLELFDARGERLSTLVDGVASPRGMHQIRLETSTLAPGMYVLRLSQDGRMVTRPVIVAR